MPGGHLIPQLDECKVLYGNAAAAARTERLLKQISRLRFSNPEDLIHLHETLLFLRAYPQNHGIVRRCDEILFGYSRRLRGLSPAELKELEYAEVSGIAGTGLTTNFSYVVARSLAERHAAKTARHATSHSKKSGDCEATSSISIGTSISIPIASRRFWPA